MLSILLFSPFSFLTVVYIFHPIFHCSLCVYRVCFIAASVWCAYANSLFVCQFDAGGNIYPLLYKPNYSVKVNIAMVCFRCFYEGS